MTMEALKKIDIEEIKTGILNSNNLNAALKNVLKKEAEKGSSLEKFSKALRKATSAKNEKVLKNTLDQYAEKYKPESILILRYVYDKEITEISNLIIEKFGEEFNSTYENKDELISLTNEDRFNEIINEVKELSQKKLKEYNMQPNTLNKFILFDTLFDKPVFIFAEKQLFS